MVGNHNLNTNQFRMVAQIKTDQMWEMMDRINTWILLKVQVERRSAETQMTARGDTGSATGLIKLRENRCAHKTRRAKERPHPQINIHEDREALRNMVKH